MPPLREPAQEGVPPHEPQNDFPYVWAGPTAPLEFGIYLVLIGYFTAKLIRYIKDGPGEPNGPKPGDPNEGKR